MKTQRYFIQPGDKSIEFPLPTNLEEIKILYQCLADRSDRDYEAGFIVSSYEALLQKLEGLIHYLQAEHYSQSHSD